MFRWNRRKTGIVIRQHLRSCNRVTSLSIPLSSSFHGLQLLNGWGPLFLIYLYMFYSGRPLSAGLGEHLQIGTQSYCLANGNITFSLAGGNSIFTDSIHGAFQEDRATGLQRGAGRGQGLMLLPSLQCSICN